MPGAAGFTMIDVVGNYFIAASAANALVRFRIIMEYPTVAAESDLGHNARFPRDLISAVHSPSARAGVHSHHFVFTRNLSPGVIVAKRVFCG